MQIIVRLDVMLARRKMTSRELADRVGISHSDIGFLLLAGLLTVIGWAMSDAARAADENRAFV